MSWDIPAYRVSFNGRKQKLESLVPSHTPENRNVNGIVDDGGNKELPVAVHQNQHGFTNPTKLPPEIPANGVENTIGNNRSNSTIIGFVSYEACLAHIAKIKNPIKKLTDGC